MSAFTYDVQVRTLGSRECCQDLEEGGVEVMVKESDIQLDKCESGDLLHGSVPKASNTACILKICYEVDLREFEASLVCTVNSRTTTAT